MRASNVNATFTGNIVLTGATGIFTQYNHATEMTITGNISGNYPLLICDDYATYPITLSGSNTYTGPTTIGYGTVDLANSAAMLNTTLLAGVWGPRPGVGTIEFDAAAGGAFTIGGLSGTGSIALDDTASNPVSLSVGNNNSSNTYSGTLSGAGSLTVIGTGVFTLAGTNTYTGGTTVTDGSTLILANNEAIEDGTNLTIGNPASFASPIVPAADVAGLQTVPQPAIAPVPEPGTLALAAAGGVAAWVLLRRGCCGRGPPACERSSYAAHADGAGNRTRGYFELG